MGVCVRVWACMKMPGPASLAAAAACCLVMCMVVHDAHHHPVRARRGVALKTSGGINVVRVPRALLSVNTANSEPPQYCAATQSPRQGPWKAGNGANAPRHRRRHHSLGGSTAVGPHPRRRRREYPARKTTWGGTGRQSGQKWHSANTEQHTSAWITCALDRARPPRVVCKAHAAWNDHDGALGSELVHKCRLMDVRQRVGEASRWPRRGL